MFGNLFSGMFGKGAPAGSLEMQNTPDALGQASMGAPMAFGAGPAQQPGYLSQMLSRFQNMDPLTRQMMMSRIGNGFSAGMQAATPQMPQLRNVYQNMTPAQQGMMFNPRGQ